jgi:hypothetical protein
MGVFHSPDLTTFKKLSDLTHNEGGNCKKFSHHKSTN